MKLSGNNGTSFELSVMGYQFPELANEDYDSNWLLISISVSHPKGSWTATDPSLLTYELRELGHWIQSIHDNPNDSKELSFIEPNLSFRYLTSKTDRILRIYFELELRPAWAPADGAGMEDLWIDIPFDRVEFSNAAKMIAEACKRFPQRTSV